LIGSLLGWNAFAGVATDITVFLQVVSTWVLGPLLAAAMAMAMMWTAKLILRNSRIGLIRLDGYTRLALLGSGALGAYSLGANNIANVVAVFLPSQPFPALSWQGFESSPTQLLLLVGGIAMASGVLTYSRRTIELVGSGLANLSPLAAWVCVSAHSLVLLLFASASLKAWLQSKGLPSLPLVPISSSQAILGAILGVGLLRGGREVNWGTVGRVALGWLVTPLVASLLCFLGLFILQNVFLLQVVGD
jgi:PiT family inorganic phosphate transporter